METSYHMGARSDIFHPLDHPSFRYQMRDKRVKLKFRACRENAYIGKPGIAIGLEANAKPLHEQIKCTIMTGILC
eukprot:scaffold91279_cov29-Attheya_sp.AAC.2